MKVTFTTGRMTFCLHSFFYSPLNHFPGVIALYDFGVSSRVQNRTDIIVLLEPSMTLSQRRVQAWICLIQGQGALRDRSKTLGP